jgi:exosortase family protein XrtM
LKSLPTSNGIPYWPDGFNPDDEPPEPRPLWLQAVYFLLVFAVVQMLYGMATDTWIQRLFVETLGSQPAARLINLVTPDTHVHAEGSRIVAPGGGINIRGGCEGTEVLFLLLAAFLAIPMPWRSRVTGIALGASLVFIFNQARILSLFYAFRADRQLFDLLHTTVAPIVFIALIAFYFYAWIHHDQHK